MARIFDREFTRSDLLQRVGDISQIAGVRQVTLEDGSEKGVQMIEASTGTGFRFNVLPSRGMDISFAEYKGIPLSWRSCTRDVSRNKGESHPVIRSQKLPGKVFIDG